MKFFSTSQVRELDKYTIEHEPIASINLMERAAQTLYIEILRHIESDQPVLIFAGPGNNGGDALALVRMLLQSTVEVKVILFNTGNLSTDCQINRSRLLEKFPNTLTEQNDIFKAPVIHPNTIIIDGLFGSGLTRPLTGIYAEAVKWINESGCEVFAIDIPSGLQGEENPDLSVPIVKASLTFSLQFPKLAFLLPENAEFVGKWQILDIGIHPEAIESTPGNLVYLTASDVAPILKKRNRFSHKGTFGHALIVAGSKGMAGASVLSSKAALRSGAGLVTVHGPECNRLIVQSTVPEVIFSSDIESDFISRLPTTELYNAIAIGPGIGTKLKTGEALKQFIKTTQHPCILDADALNIISHYKEINFFIPKNSIFTPHPKEFDRLFGASQNTFERISKASAMAQKLGIIIILKGAHTLIATPDGNQFFNSTGNAGMATAGSGDVLTGMLVGLLAQGYSPEDAAKLGVFLHGRAGDLALNEQSEESLIASDIIRNIHVAFRSLKVK